MHVPTERHALSLDALGLKDPFKELHTVYQHWVSQEASFAKVFRWLGGA